jgi:hypothetical protein
MNGEIHYTTVSLKNSTSQFKIWLCWGQKPWTIFLNYYSVNLVQMETAGILYRRMVDANTWNVKVVSTNFAGCVLVNIMGINIVQQIMELFAVCVQSLDSLCYQFVDLVCMLKCFYVLETYQTTWLPWVSFHSPTILAITQAFGIFWAYS